MSSKPKVYLSLIAANHGAPPPVYVTDGGDKIAEEWPRLDPRYDLRNHSPDGFSWGYGGSGPSQLALAILADATGDDDYALRHYQEFKWAFVAPYRNDLPFYLDAKDIDEWLEGRSKKPEVRDAPNEVIAERRAAIAAALPKEEET